MQDVLHVNNEDEASSLRLLFQKLECNIVKEIKSYWHKITLTESLEWIPGGLRVKKFSTFDLFDGDLKLNSTHLSVY